MSAALSAARHTVDNAFGSSALRRKFLVYAVIDSDDRHSITYWIAIGPQAGRKGFMLQTLTAHDEPFDARVGKGAGFPLLKWRHARMSARSWNACAGIALFDVCLTARLVDYGACA